MDNREMWAVKLWGLYKHDSHQDGGRIEQTWTVHVVTEKGYKSAIEAALESAKDWDAEVRGVKLVGAAPLVVA